MTSNALRDHIAEIVQQHGVSLAQGGSNEPGLPSKVAANVVQLLLQLNQPILGIEVWRPAGGSAYSISSLDGWYAQSEDVACSASEALAFLQSAALKEGDVVTIQSTTSL